MKINVCVLFGGKSTEHEISIISALQLIENFDYNKYNVIPVYISKSNEFYTGEKLLNIKNYQNINLLLKKLKKVNFIKENEKVFLEEKKNFYYKKIYQVDCVFLVVHGTNAEDGTLSGYLNLLDCPYVGSDVCASALSMDKYYTKCILKYNDIDVVDGYLFNIYENTSNIVKKVEEKLKYPVIVKPNNLGSSIGIKSANNKEELIEAINYSFMFSKYILIEEKIENFKEINCSVLGDSENCEASCLEEVVKTDEILSFKDKYLNSSKSVKGMESLSRIIPAKIEKEAEEEIKRISKKIFKLFRNNAVVRIDYILDNTNGKIYVNEINNIPGSLANYLWKESGKSYSQLIDDLIKLAFKRHREEKKINYTFDSNVLNNCNSIKK